MRCDQTVLFSDLDGTLFDSRGEISSENRLAIEEYKARGGKFSISTGREPRNAMTYVRENITNAPSVAINGSAIYDFGTGEYLYTVTIPRRGDGGIVFVGIHRHAARRRDGRIRKAVRRQRELKRRSHAQLQRIGVRAGEIDARRRAGHVQEVVGAAVHAVGVRPKVDGLAVHRRVAHVDAAERCVAAGRTNLDPRGRAVEGGTVQHVEYAATALIPGVCHAHNEA